MIHQKLNKHSGVIALAALAMALFGAGPAGVNAAIHFITGKQIKNGSLTTKDIRNSTLRSADLANNSVGDPEIQPEAVAGSDVANESITPVDTALPEPTEVVSDTPAMALINGTTFQKVYDIGTFTKEVATSELEVTWTGSAEEGQEQDAHQACVFQLRVDGAAPGGGGEVFVKGQASVSVTALFGGLAAGPHTVEVWARHTGQGNGPTSCLIDPSSIGIDQSFIVSEQAG